MKDVEENPQKSQQFELCGNYWNTSSSWTLVYGHNKVQLAKNCTSTVPFLYT